MRIKRFNLCVGAFQLIFLSFFMKKEPATHQTVWVVGGLVLIWIATAFRNE